MKEDTAAFSDAKLRRKAEQAWEMAGCARRDHDSKDEQKWIKVAQKYDQELKERNDGRR